MEEKDKQVTYTIIAKEGSQINLANDSGTINASQYNSSESSQRNEKDKRSIQNLIESYEYKAALDLLRNLELNIKDESEFMFVCFNMGRCYLHLSDKVNSDEKEKYLFNAYYYLCEAEKKREYATEKELIDLYILTINTCIRLGKLKKEIIFFETGVTMCEERVKALINNNINDVRKYTLLLDYALLLDEISKYCNSSEAKGYLIKEYLCYILISDLEELIDIGVDYDTAFRLFNNAGRCSEQLIEYAEDEEEEQRYIKSAEELYKNALNDKLANLRKFPKNYGIVYNNLGNLYSRKFAQKILVVTNQEALSCYEKALSAYKDIKEFGQYYEVMSNKARVLNSIYQESKNDEDYFKTEDLLSEIIKARGDMNNISGAYFSRFHLAQLYMYYAQIKQDQVSIQKAIDILKGCVEYFTEEYIPDYYYKIEVSRFKALVLLVRLKNDGNGCKELIEKIGEFMICKKNNISNKILDICAELVIELFFLIIDNELLGEQIQLYQYISEKFRDVNLKIENYISVN